MRWLKILDEKLAAVKYEAYGEEVIVIVADGNCLSCDATKGIPLRSGRMNSSSWYVSFDIPRALFV